MRITGNTFILILFTSFVLQQAAHAQCTTPVNAFPYNEGFETSNGNWSPSSSAHWEWGAPVGKVEITGAASGTRCWVGGGLTGNPYASGISELVSPCFDLSSLSYPEISLKIFWESEFHFDGAALEYSLDGGSNWVALGSANSNDPCLGIGNWFNHDDINKLQHRQGWSGNVQSSSGNCQGGNGSGQWLNAKHNLSALIGQSNVKFKFLFGAGTECNAYDGVAIDDIHIGEAATNTGDFSYSCGANNSAQFNNTSLSCQTGWSWDFGYPASGQDNFSFGENPSHTFSSPGTYNVSLLVYYGWGPAAVVPPKTVNVINVNPVITNAIKCNGDQNGAITVNVNPSGAYNYTWDTNPVQTTPAISNLGPATYTVTVTATNTCSVSVPVTLNNPDPLTLNPVVTPAKCGNDNGTITANAAGGTLPYLYNWSNSQSTPVISNLPAGVYGLWVQDANGCTVPPINNLTVQPVTYNIIISLGKDTTICPGQTLILNPGIFASWLWQDNSTGPTFTVTKTGDYGVQVTDIYGCTGSANIHVTVDCKGVFFPSAFTPNSDAVNPAFGPVGDIGSLREYSLVVYNRYAEVVFSSTDPFKKWDGSFKGKAQDTQSFVWTAKYILQGKPVQTKGTVLILR